MLGHILRMNACYRGDLFAPCEWLHTVLFTFLVKQIKSGSLKFDRVYGHRRGNGRISMFNGETRPVKIADVTGRYTYGFSCLKFLSVGIAGQCRKNGKGKEKFSVHQYLTSAAGRSPFQETP